MVAVVAAWGHMRLTRGALIQGLQLVSCAAPKCGPDTQFWGEIADSGSWDRRAGSCSRRRILPEISQILLQAWQGHVTAKVLPGRGGLWGQDASTRCLQQPWN